MNHLDGRGYGHFGGLALHAGNGGEPLPQRFRTRARGIELTREPADACGSQDISASNVTGATGPNEICRRGVLFAAVDVAYLDIPHRSTECARPLARRRAGSRAVA